MVEPADNVLSFPTTGPRLEHTDKGKRVFTPLTDRLDIGRSRENDLRLKDDQVSSAHCHIERRGEGFVIVDDDSRNGVKVNGIRVQGRDHKVAQLHDGDELTIGRSRLVVRLGPLAERWPKRPLSRPPRYRPNLHGDDCVVMGQQTLQAALTDADREAMRVASRAALPVQLLGGAQEEALEAVRDRNERWEKCRKLSKRLRSGGETEQTALRLVKAVGQVLPVDAAVVFLADARGALQRRAEAERIETAHEVAASMSVVDTARNTAQVVTRLQGAAQLLAVPLGDDRTTRGVLYAIAPSASTLTDDDMRMLFQLTTAAELGFGFRSA